MQSSNGFAVSAQSSTQVAAHCGAIRYEVTIDARNGSRKTASRLFCKHCGVHCFGHGHIPKLGGDFMSINYNALDDVDPKQVNVVYWYGRHDNWEAGPRTVPWPFVAQSLEQPAA